jgi:hypothetical protein
MIGTYNTFQHPGTGFNVPHSGDMPQLPPTYFLGGMSNAVMTMDDPGSYEIAPEVYEAFSYAQPITTNMTPMTPVFEQGWGGPPQ